MSADSLREEGNEKFKAGDYAAAIEAYTKALDIDPKLHLCFSNRSAAYLKLGNSAEKALSDAIKCIELRPEFGKGYSRKAAALQELERWDEAIATCEQGIATASDDALRTTLRDVRNRKFRNQIKGAWHGTVTEELGGYSQEMEFNLDSTVRVEVLGRSIIGRYDVDATVEPAHLNIQVPMPDMPPGMPPPPPVPYIAKREGEALLLCCPYMAMERPQKFEGPGHCIMKPGKIQKAVDASIASLSGDEKLQRCTKELASVMPKDLEVPSQHDTEEEAQRKVMIQVKWESTVFKLTEKYGEDVVKEVMGFAAQDDGSSGIPKAVASLAEFKELREQVQRVKKLEEKHFQAQQAQSPAPAREEKKPASGAGEDRQQSAKQEDESKDNKSTRSTSMKKKATIPAEVIIVGMVAAASATAIALLLWRRRKS